MEFPPPIETMSKLKLLVTSALPYANGPIHLGHIAGAYLPADIYVRFNRLLGNDVVYVCGTDEHGVPIALRAEQENVTPRTIVKRYHEEIKKAFDRLNISFDIFSGTSKEHNKYHAHLAREFFTNLLKKDFICTHIGDQYYCKNCARFLADRFIEGTCPKCGNPQARGDECSACNAPFEVMELKNPRCKLCSQSPELKATKHWYLRLDMMQKALEKWLDAKTYWKENVLTFAKGWFQQGLKERSITRDLYWGVPVPLDGAVGKVLYVWFDAPIGYISATMQWAEEQGKPDKWQEYWKNPDCRVIHFIGKDNISFHAIIWPAMLMGQESGYQLPWHVPANEYLNFGLTKASKSIGNVVWVHEAVEIFSADQLRYYLAACAPEKQDTMFTWQDFQQKCNGELLGVLGNLANRSLKFIGTHFDRKVPVPKDLNARDREVLETIRNTPAKVSALYSNFEVRNAIGEIVNLGRLGNQYFDEKAPWKSVKDSPTECGNCMYVTAQMLRALAVMLAPVIPESAQKLWEQLGYTTKIAQWDEATQEVPAGHSLGAASGIFNKIEDETIKPLEAKLEEAVRKDKSTPEQAKPAESAKPEATSEPKKIIAEKKTAEPVEKAKAISLATFQSLDLRIGEIMTAEKVAKSNKLLKLTVKIGTEIRQVVSGIAAYYEPDKLIGRKVPLILNLEPAKIHGTVSEGMILCADINGRPVLLFPEQDVPAGAIIR